MKQLKYKFSISFNENEHAHGKNVQEILFVVMGGSILLPDREWRNSHYPGRKPVNVTKIVVLENFITNGVIPTPRASFFCIPMRWRKGSNTTWIDYVHI